MFPVGMLGFLSSGARSRTMPVAVMTYSSRRDSARVKLSLVSGVITSWMRPLWSLRSMKMRPPWSRREFTQPATVTFSVGLALRFRERLLFFILILLYHMIQR